MDLHILNELGVAIFGSAHSKGVRYEGVVIPTGIVTYSYTMSRVVLAYCQTSIEIVPRGKSKAPATVRGRYRCWSISFTRACGARNNIASG